MESWLSLRFQHCWAPVPDRVRRPRVGAAGRCSSLINIATDWVRIHHGRHEQAVLLSTDQPTSRKPREHQGAAETDVEVEVMREGKEEQHLLRLLLFNVSSWSSVCAGMEHGQKGQGAQQG